jgi:hypothetical protein
MDMFVTPTLTVRHTIRCSVSHTDRYIDKTKVKWHLPLLLHSSSLHTPSLLLLPFGSIGHAKKSLPVRIMLLLTFVFRSLSFVLGNGGVGTRGHRIPRACDGMKRNLLTIDCFGTQFPNVRNTWLEKK